MKDPYKKILLRHPELKTFLSDYDHIDIKTVSGNKSMREFLAGMMSYQPLWLIFLFKLRIIVVRILGLKKQEKLEDVPHVTIDNISFASGENVAFFITRAAKEDEYWVGETPEDKHLEAFVCVVREKIKNNQQQFHVITMVRYRHISGPIYFNLIRPFHHLVVYKMALAGVAGN